jgi:polar amino acid transport system ATP-binding protein
VCVIGPSGSGKSTMLRCCNLLETPAAAASSWTARHHARPRHRPEPVRQDIGMVFQQFNLYPHLSALDNVTLALRKVQRRPKAEAERRWRSAALEQVGLGTRPGRFPPSCRAASSSAWASRARWRSSRT